KHRSPRLAHLSAASSTCLPVALNLSRCNSRRCHAREEARRPPPVETARSLRLENSSSGSSRSPDNSHPQPTRRQQKNRELLKIATIKTRRRSRRCVYQATVL